MLNQPEERREPEREGFLLLVEYVNIFVYVALISDNVKTTLLLLQREEEKEKLQKTSPI